MEGSPSWSPPEEFEVVVRKDRKHGLGIELSRDCRVIGFHGRAAQDAGVPLGAQLLSVAGINLRGVPSIADASEKEEQMDRLMQSAGRRTAAGDNVTLRLRRSPSALESDGSPSALETKAALAAESKFRVGDACEIYSKRCGVWCSAVVTQNPQGKLMVEYIGPGGDEMQKSLRKATSNGIRRAGLSTSPRKSFRIRSPMRDRHERTRPSPSQVRPKSERGRSASL